MSEEQEQMQDEQETIEDSVKYFTFHASGKDEDEAESKLASKVDDYRNEYGLNLEGEPENSYQVLLFKGEKPGRSNLQGQGSSYKEALEGCVEDFGVDASQFNKKVMISSRYELSEEDVEAANNVPPPSAGIVYDSSESLEEFIL